MPLQYINDPEQPHVGGNFRHGDHNTIDVALWEDLVKRFAIRSMLDVGCGEGHAVWNFARMGVIAHGIDGLAKNVERAVYPIALHDLTKDSYLMPVDLVITIEVAEHIEEEYLGFYLDTVCNAKKAIAMTHALPGQEGYHHVNCRESEYWIRALQPRGYRLDYYNEHWRNLARAANPDSFFGLTGLVFVRADV